MISIIVPVYNVEPYLRRCLDSIIEQTYRDLEILVIDDGSTDQSGKICDEYEKLDERIRVIHTENRGLSAARNLGLYEATGEWIGFVDSDDWIEPDMYEVLLRKAEKAGVDIVECGWINELQNQAEINEGSELFLRRIDVVNALLCGRLSNAVWNKLWRRECFSCVRFPEGRIYEEYATTYRVFIESQVCSIAEMKYHYFWREGSLSRSHDIKNLCDYWYSQKERFDDLYNTVDDEAKQALLKGCATAIGRTWAYYYECTYNEHKKNTDIIQEMNQFSRRHFPLLGKKDWSISLKTAVFFSHFTNRLSLKLACIINCIKKRLHKK